MLFAQTAFMPSQLSPLFALPMFILGPLATACGQAVTNDVSPGALGNTTDTSETVQRDEVSPTTETIRLEHYRASCQGLGARSCFLTEDGLFYDGIDGFEYHWGLVHTIEVDVYEVQDPPADGSSRRYELARVLKTERPADPTFEVLVFDASLVAVEADNTFRLFDEVYLDCKTNTLCSLLGEKLSALAAAGDPLQACFALTLEHGAEPGEPLTLTEIHDDPQGWGCH